MVTDRIVTLWYETAQWWSGALGASMDHYTDHYTASSKQTTSFRKRIVQWDRTANLSNPQTKVVSESRFQNHYKIQPLRPKQILSFLQV